MTENLIEEVVPNLIKENEIQTKKKQNPWRKILLFLFFGFCILAVFIYQFVLTSISEAKGKVFSEKEQEIGTLSEGVLKEIYVKNAQKVKEGDMLFELSNQEIENQTLELSKKKEDIEESLKFLGKERLHARSSFERAGILFENGVISKGEFEGAELNQEKTESKYSELENQISNLNLKLNELEREDELLIVRSPFAGVYLGNFEWAKDTFLKKGEVLGQIFDTSKFYFSAYFDEKDISKIRIGDLCEVEFDAFPGVYKGTVSDMDGKAHEITEKVYKVRNVVQVKITLESFPDGLKPRMKGKARIITRKKHGFELSGIKNSLSQIKLSEKNLPDFWMNKRKGGSTIS